ncbi:MAG TPA: lytic transglycosylase domain-containing protein [Streptosporangiaceae bacterium]|nr:lytic transglycosylase domain-containing protein [Streptosporangiaceae bacterium]
MLTHSVTITTVVVVGLGVIIANISLGKGAPPPAGASQLSTNDMLALVSHDYVTPGEAAGIAAAKKRAHEAQIRAERAAREKARRESIAARKRAAARAAARAKARAEAEARRLAGIPNPSAAENQALGKRMNAAKGWSSCWPSLLELWTRESHWNERAHNPYSGAHGVPQALPGSKMASAGPNWETNSVTQIAWGLSYISARYGNPCKAWTFWQNNHWY